MKNRSLVQLGWLVAVLFAQSVSVHAKDLSSITIATEGNYEPWNLTSADGKLDGFEVEMMKDLCKRMQITCKLVVQNWDDMIANLKTGKFDVMMDSIVISDERKKEVAFSTPYASTSASFVAAQTSYSEANSASGKQNLVLQRHANA